MKSKVQILIFFCVTAFNAYSQENINQVDLKNMVSMQTGDFNYSLEIMSIPNIDANFPLFLNYSAGIGLNQEASLVGLGWHFNPGSILRNVSEIPDDYKGQIIYTKQTDPGGEEKVEAGSFFDNLFSGINRKLYRAGRSIRNEFFGGQGSLHSAMKDLYEATYSYYTLGGLVGGVGNASIQGSTYHNPETNKVEMQGGGGISINPLVLYKAIRGPKINFMHLTSWDWIMLEEREKRKILWLETNWDKSITYKWYLDELKEEKGYGILYQSDVPKTTAYHGSSYLFNPEFTNSSLNQELQFFNGHLSDSDHPDRSLDENFASDYYQPSSLGQKEYENTAPIFFATDFYRVAAPGLNGELQPVRFDNPSMATSFVSNKFYYPRTALHKHNIGTTQSSKVQFVMLEDQSNSFHYHYDAFDGDYDLKYTPSAVVDDDLGNIRALHFDEQSKALTSLKPADETYNGDNLLFKGVAINWFSTREILNGSAYASGFIDHPEINRDGYNPHSIGGFSIIGKDGQTYHFAIPVYGSERSTLTVDETTNENYFETPYPVTWLLTAITGSDFSDSGKSPGFIDDGDKGRYVTIEYGKYSNDFDERFPAAGFSYTPDDIDVLHERVVTEEKYYINSISTPTHTALFAKKVRKDFKSSSSGTSLALDEILLFKNTSYDQLKNLMGPSYIIESSYVGGFPENVLKIEDINRSSIKEFIDENVIKRVKFEYDYSLCRGVPTSDEGKLTLKNLIFSGGDNVPYSSYEFEYQSNPDYNSHSWDAWGFYKNNPSPGIDNHKVETADDGTAWSLTGIYIPLGAKIEIGYERDKYYAVSGQPLEEGVEEKWGGNLRVTDILLSVENNGNKKIFTGYNFNYLDGGKTSGVATMEPTFCKGLKREFEDIYKYPAPVVTYGKVKRSRLYKDREVIDDIIVSRFLTADDNTVTISKDLNDHQILTNDQTVNNLKVGSEIRKTAYNINYEDDKIGLILSSQKLDKDGNPIHETKYEYENAEYGGFTQGLHLLDNTFRAYALAPGDEGKLDKRISYRFINSIIKRSPSRISRITEENFKSGVKSYTTFFNQDIYTGSTKGTKHSDSYGNTFLVKDIPAYEKYSGMASHFLGGKNLLNADAGKFIYKVDALNEPIGLVSAHTQAFSNEIPVNEIEVTSNRWYLESSFIWDGQKKLKEDGTYDYDDFILHPFDWANPTESTNWERLNQITLYGHFSHALEAVDMNGNKAATRMDPKHHKVIASSTNAAYHETGYSGAENLSGSTDPEGGVAKGNGSVSTAHVHTGHYSLMVAPRQSGFSFTLDESKADLSKKYRASVWVYLPGDPKEDSEIREIELFYTIDGHEIKKAVPSYAKNRSKSWYLLNLDIDPSAGGDIFIGCRNNAPRAAYFDDFRVHPLDASMSSYVYDAQTDELTYILGPNNFYTRYEYDGAGRVIRTYKERLNFHFKEDEDSYKSDQILQEVKYNFGRN